MEIVEAALTSTRTYLKFLDVQHRGVERYRAALGSSDSPIEGVANGQLQWFYTFQTDPRLRITVDGALAYIPSETGSDRISVLVQSYDRNTGKIVLGFSEQHKSESGTIEINFRWLPQRLKLWLEENGDRIVSPSDLTLPAEVPSIESIQTWLSKTGVFSPRPSESQTLAIVNALTKPFSYAWGPPGSGKTDYVLTATVLFLLEKGKRVLVLAPTNQAVENALRAILYRLKQACLETSCVLRVGIATPEFLEEFPENCEDVSVHLKESDSRAERVRR